MINNQYLINSAMTTGLFYCLANILLFTFLIMYSTSYTRRKSNKRNLLIKNINKLEKIYRLNSYEDSYHN